MPEFFLELFSEEIPARMQARAADELARLVGEALGAVSPAEVRSFYGPRRIALVAQVSAGVAESRSVERGPRVSAPEQALAGFLRKHGAVKEQLRAEGDFWVLDRVVPGVEAGALVASVMPGVLRRFSWPKSMRWGGTSGFAWVRPLRRIVCLLDGVVVPFALAEQAGGDGADDGHGLVAGGVSEGHRFHAPGAFVVTSCAQWAAELLRRQVVVDAGERRRMIAEGLRDLAATRGLAVVERVGVDLFRVAGIYGPGRSAFDELRAGRARRVLKPGHAFGRIHRDDIAGAVLAAVMQDRAAGVRVLHLADDEPSESAAVIAEAARLLGVAVPAGVDFAEAVAGMSEMARSFWAENRKVASERTQELLGYRWRYPSFREGLRAILGEG